jgi:hypothetical protein
VILDQAQGNCDGRATAWAAKRVMCTIVGGRPPLLQHLLAPRRVLYDEIRVQ